MELFYTILGFAMMYSWGHTGYLMITKMKKLTGYQTFITIVGVASMILVIIGALMK